MLGLRELQSAFADLLAGRPRTDLAGLIADGAIPAASRLAVHRHHVVRTLGNALAANFPTVHALVGKDFFVRLARDFLAACLPAGPVVAEYGAGLARFISSYPPAVELPYLADVARLDWAMNVASCAPRSDRLTAAGLAAVDVEHLASRVLPLPPGASVVESDYPLDRIWRASQPGADDRPVALDGGPCRLLVLPDGARAFFVTLSGAEAAFMTALAQGHTFERAADAGLAADGNFDLGASFARLLQLEAFAALQ